MGRLALMRDGLFYTCRSYLLHLNHWIPEQCKQFNFFYGNGKFTFPLYIRGKAEASFRNR